MSYSTHVYGAASPEQGTQTVTLDLEDLQPSTTYHYRILASNQGGTSEGADQTFTTAPATTPITAPTTPLLLATPSIAFRQAARKTRPSPKPRSRPGRRSSPRR